MDISNLPDWPGASTVYSRCAIVAAHMARNGHCPITYARRRGSLVPIGSTPSADLIALTVAMGLGDEEAMKAAIAANLSIIFPESLT